MRILHVSAYYAPAFVYGGPPRSIHGLCRSLRRAGASLQVFTTDANGAGALPMDDTASGHYEEVPVTYFPRSWPMHPIGSRALSQALRATMRTTDVVHIHGLWNRVVWAAAREARLAGVPYVLSPRGMLEEAAVAHHQWRKRAAYALIERRTIEGASLLHATSEREAQHLKGWSAPGRVTLIPNGIDAPTPGLLLERDMLGLPPTGPIVMFLGRLHPIKRLNLVVDSFVLLKKRHPEAHLVVAGPDESGLGPALLARSAAAADSITWTGAVDTQRRDALLRESSALVLCSDSESFGMAVPEAMALGVPVVVTGTCGWRDVRDHRAGFVVEQEAPAIAAALSALLDLPEAAEAMGERGRRLVEEKYRWDRIAETFLREYRALVTGRVPLRAVIR